MRPHAGQMFWLLVVTGIVLAGCGDAKTDSGDAEPIGQGQPVDDSTADGDLKIPTLSPELAAKWREHTLDLPFVVGYEEGMKLAESNDRPAMMYITTTW